MSEEISAFITILEHPNIKKGYINYLNYLKSKNREEFKAFEYLIEKKFHDNSTNNNTK
jgi:hypothetical protein